MAGRAEGKLMFGRFFSRRPGPGRPGVGGEPGKDRPGDSPEDWHAGDQAECILSGPWYVHGVVPAAGPRQGERFVVREVALVDHPILGRAQFLSLSSWPGVRFAAAAFRKVRPQADELVAAEPRWLNRLLGTPARRQLEDA